MQTNLAIITQATTYDILKWNINIVTAQCCYNGSTCPMWSRKAQNHRFGTTEGQPRHFCAWLALKVWDEYSGRPIVGSWRQEAAATARQSYSSESKSVIFSVTGGALKPCHYFS